MFISSGRDTEAAVIPIAFILFVAIFMSGLYMYEATILPVQSENAEISSNRDLVTDINEFERTLDTATKEGVPQPFALGNHPDYPLLAGMYSPVYQFATGENESIMLGNFSRDCTADGGSLATVGGATPPGCGVTGNYTYFSRNAHLQPFYPYFDEPSVFAYEFGVTFSAPVRAVEGDSTIVARNDQPIIESREIRLYTLQSNFTFTSDSNVHGNIIPKSSDPLIFKVTNQTGEKVRLTLPTELSKSEWQRLLKDEMVANGGYVESISYTSVTTPSDSSPLKDFDFESSPNYVRYPCPPASSTPYVRCSDDTTTNYVTFTFAQNELYTLKIYSIDLVE